MTTLEAMSEDELLCEEEESVSEYGDTPQDALLQQYEHREVVLPEVVRVLRSESN